MDKLLNRHIELVEAVNNSTDAKLRRMQFMYLTGFRAALEEMGINQFVECDMYYLDQGIDRPMCGGVFTDWKPQHISETCTDSECHECGEKDCPHGEPLHYHHDGCPACDGGDWPNGHICVDGATGYAGYVSSEEQGTRFFISKVAQETLNLEGFEPISWVEIGSNKK